MKVSDRQWSVGDVMRVTLGELIGCTGTVKRLNGSSYPVTVDFGGDTETYRLCSDTEVELVTPEKPAPPTIEQRAVRLAEVYWKAYGAAAVGFVGADKRIAHDIAMLLVKRELEAGDG